MADGNLNDLLAFLAVARERSFTRAAAKLGVSQSALSQTVRGLEERLGLRLLARTTRSVAPTDAGERLLQSVGPRIDGINQDLAALGEMRDKPAGVVRITADENAARTVLWPAIQKLLPDYPDIKIEVVIDYGLTDIVADRYDAGVRLGGMIAKDMIAVPIGPEMRMATVGSPSYLTSRPAPVTPQDLTEHACINLRLPTYGGLYAWEYEKGKRELKVRVDGQLVFNSVSMILEAARSGFGLAHMTEVEVQADLDGGQLVRVLADWCPPFSGYHLYYPSRRLPSPAFSLMVEALRYRRRDPANAAHVAPNRVPSKRQA